MSFSLNLDLCDIFMQFLKHRGVKISQYTRGQDFRERLFGLLLTQKSLLNAKYHE